MNYFVCLQCLRGRENKLQKNHFLVCLSLEESMCF